MAQRDTILGKKLGMTQIFDRKGNALPVTLIQAGPCTVVQVKDPKKDGYAAVQLGFEEKRAKSVNKPEAGHFAKASTTPKKVLREMRVDDASAWQVGQVVTAGIFKVGDFVDVAGVSKGKGYAGAMKRHNYKGFGASHGVHESFRGPGSIGQHTDPGRVFKGVMQAGHLGTDNTTVQNLAVVDVREDLNIIAVKGPIPGGKNGTLVVTRAKKKKSKAKA